MPKPKRTEADIIDRPNLSVYFPQHEHESERRRMDLSKVRSVGRGMGWDMHVDSDGSVNNSCRRDAEHILEAS